MIMQIHEIKPTHRPKEKKRVGRGGKRGTYSGRGIKGQKARAGHKIKSAAREMILKLPKQRGIKFKSRWRRVTTLNISDIEKQFNSGEKVTRRTLLQKGLIRQKGGRLPEVKILAGEKVAKKLIYLGLDVSRQAKEKIEAAGGKVVS